MFEGEKEKWNHFVLRSDEMHVQCDEGRFFHTQSPLTPILKAVLSRSKKTHFGRRTDEKTGSVSSNNKKLSLPSKEPPLNSKRALF